MRLLKNFEIQTKISILSAGLLFIAFFILGFIVFDFQKKRVEKSFNENINYQLQAIDNSIATLNSRKREQIKKGLDLASFLMQETYTIKETVEDFEIQTRNESTHESYPLKVKVWRSQGMRLHTNTEMVDMIRQFSGSEVGIFQQTKKGYVQISTTILNRRAERANGVFYPNSASISKVIEKGEKFMGQLSFDGIDYIANARPYYIRGRIKGFIVVGKPVYINYEIERILDNLNLIPNSTLNLINTRDKLVYSSNELKMSFPVSISSLKISNSELKILKGIEDEFVKKFFYIKFLKSIDYYLALEIPEESVFVNLNNFRLMMIIATVIAGFFLFVGLYLIFKKFSIDIKNLLLIMEDFALGKNVSFNAQTFSKEIEKMISTLKSISNSNLERAEFAKNLKSGMLDSEFRVLSNEDTLGNSLIELREALKIASQTVKETQEYDEKAKWFNTGKSKISDILREHSSNIIGLGDELIKEIIHFLNIPLGGIFIINEDKARNKYLDLLSAYAYDRKKFLETKILIGDGLIGACAEEQYTMHVKGLPSDYVKIESGLGGKGPDFLLLVPVIADNNTLGVIELASFKEFSQQEVKYIEAISEAIASTITITRLNTQTSILLEESKEQIEYLEQERDKYSQELGSLQVKFDKLKRDYTDTEFQYKTQIVKKQMSIDNLNRRLENLDTNIDSK
ncbi:MAG: Cache 3/Cache 2 fusion domain-containing protein [Bacteroidales bacterium]|nr:Cache 3/Cache 2 fusion domain-containing protein [Bacteroidales bacterium]